MKTKIKFLCFCFLAFACCLSAQAQPRTLKPSDTEPPPGKVSLSDLGHHTRRITTRSRQAQRAFDRGLTLAYAFNHGTADEVGKEQALLAEASAKVPAGYTFGNNAASNILAIASNVLAGEIAAQAGRFDDAVASLQSAVKLEDSLRYDEPPDWIQPARHTLGAVLLRAGRAAEAEQVYREDLRRNPENGWSLFGLGRALRKQGKDTEAKGVEHRFAEAWSKADIQLQATCLCQPGD